MNANTKKAIFEAIREIGRLVVLGLPALAIQVISNDPTLSVYAGGAILFVLRAVDKYIHTNPKLDKNGLLPF